MYYEFWENRGGKQYLLWSTKDIRTLKDSFSAFDNTYIRCRGDDIGEYIIDCESMYNDYIEDFYDRKYAINQDKEPEMAITQTEFLGDVRKKVNMIIHNEMNPVEPTEPAIKHTIAAASWPDDIKTKPVDNNPKTAVALSKPRLSDVPPVALFALGAAMSDGASKYGRFNYRDTSVTSSVFYDAIIRHLVDWYNGEDYAHDSGVHHLGHIMASCAILLDGELHGTLKDDRDTRKPDSIARNPTWKA